VHVKGGFGKDECSGIGEGRARRRSISEGGHVCTSGSPVHGGVEGAGIDGTGHLEEARCVDERVNTRSLSRATESVDGRRKSINGIGVVERLSAEGLEENRCGVEGRAVIDVGIRLDNPDEFLARVVEVELNLVGG
jgi:hypothetical protein